MAISEKSGLEWVSVNGADTGDDVHVGSSSALLVAMEMGEA